MITMKTPDALFHYLSRPAAARVMALRQLQPKPHLPGLARRGKPFVLWSADAEWDPMANTLARRSHGSAEQSDADSSDQWRFRLDCRRPDALNAVGIKLIPWARLPLQARLESRDVAELQRAAAASGSDVGNWWVCLDSVSTSLELSGLLRLEARLDGLWTPETSGLGSTATAP